MIAKAFSRAPWIGRIKRGGPMEFSLEKECAGHAAREALGGCKRAPKHRQNDQPARLEHIDLRNLSYSNTILIEPNGRIMAPRVSRG